MRERYPLSRHVAPRQRTGAFKTYGDKLACACWCERNYVLVTPEDVWAGLTYTCGHRQCKEPDGR